MANAYKCDSCGEYQDEGPAVITVLSPGNAKLLKYDLCPFCLNEVIEAITREKVFSDYTTVNETMVIRNVTAHIMECSACGRTYEHVNGNYEHCPHCKAKIVE